jgi:hypothetical protein
MERTVPSVVLGLQKQALLLQAERAGHSLLDNTAAMLLLAKQWLP